MQTALTDNLQNEVNYLFNRYLSISVLEEYARITSQRVIKDLLTNIFQISKIDIRREYPLHGKTSHFTYDLAIFGNVNKYIHAISFDETGALDRTKIFDWSVKDTIERYHNLSLENFVPVISEPSADSPSYERILEKFRDALRILSAAKYPIVTYQSGESWKKKINEILSV